MIFTISIPVMLYANLDLPEEAAHLQYCDQEKIVKELLLQWLGGDETEFPVKVETNGFVEDARIYTYELEPTCSLYNLMIM